MKKQTILITGATTGIGRATALHLARLGHRVFATGRNEAALASLVEEAKGTALEAFRLDVTDPESIASARALVDERTGGAGLDVLVNNAGFGMVAPLALQPEADVRSQFETNVFGLLAVTRAFLPAMQARGDGRIINVSSVGGRMTFPFFGAYNATKYAVESLSNALRQEMRPFGVHVVLIEPGVIQSEFADRSTAGVARWADPGSPWAFALSRSEEMRVQADRMAVGPEVIARAVRRAVEARRPAARIMAPFRTKILLLLSMLLPTRAFDFLLGASVGLTSGRRAAYQARLAAGSQNRNAAPSPTTGTLM